MIRIAIAAATAAIAAAPAAHAHGVVVDPRGNGQGTSHHVGQAAAAGHNSCFGHLTAASNEQSAAVTFLGPPACPPR